MFFKIIVFKNFAIFTRKQLYWSLFLIKLQVFTSETLSKEIPANVFYCEYCEIFMNSCFYIAHLVVAFDTLNLLHTKLLYVIKQ